LEARLLKVSVVIRTRDKERCFDRLLENLALQTVQASEIIVVNNYSNDEERQILENELDETVREYFRHRKTRIRLVALSDDEFSHAYSTNLGVNSAENELVCLTNAHSLPTSLCWLRDGTRHFEDLNVAGVSGFFIPSQEGTVAGKFDAMMYHFSERIVLRQDWCSTINCVIRKSFWMTYPFDENLPKIIPEARIYGLEDYDWSKEMTARNFRIVIDPAFSVFHSHSRGLNEMARNIKNYFIYRRIQQKINLLDRPRESFSKVFQTEDSVRVMEIHV
jgi:glycosyltransferase involved in cell wall biosynthesis